MKRLLVTIILVISFSTVIAAPPPPAEGCECCIPEWIEGDPDNFAYYACHNACEEPEPGIQNPCEVIPIDQNILLLLIAGIGLGSYKIYTQRKKATS